MKEYLYITKIDNPQYSKTVVTYDIENLNLSFKTNTFGVLCINCDMLLISELTNLSNIYHGKFKNLKFLSFPEYCLG